LRWSLKRATTSSDRRQRSASFTLAEAVVQICGSDLAHAAAGVKAAATNASEAVARSFIISFPIGRGQWHRTRSPGRRFAGSPSVMP
jgi:hypothetical protein